MPNFVTLCPILIYLPAIVIVLVAMITGVTHGLIAWMGRRPAALSAKKGKMRVRKTAWKGSLPASAAWASLRSAHPKLAATKN